VSAVSDLIIAPSLLASDFGRLADAAEACRRAGASYLHFDIMDGRFVPNISMGPYAVEALRPVSDALFDVHLMIVEPERYIDEFVRAGANSVTVQVEACVHLQRTLAHIRSLGAHAGVALNPATPIDVLEYVLDDLDLILVMTVNPGFGGQEFLPATLPKIRRVREMIEKVSHPIQLEVDGGISAATAPAAVRAGANVLVAGTSVFHHPKGVAGGVNVLREACTPVPAPV
jgi:ribulose-phosphate 3-epimerase